MEHWQIREKPKILVKISCSSDGQEESEIETRNRNRELNRLINIRLGK